MDKEQHINDISNIIRQSDNEPNLIIAELIRYAISHNYSFCNNSLNERSRLTYVHQITNLSNTAPNHTFNKNELSIFLHHYYRSPQMVVILDDGSWHQNTPLLSSSKLKRLHVELNQLTDTCGDGLVFANKIAQVLACCLKPRLDDISEISFKLFGPYRLIDLNIITPDKELPLQILTQVLQQYSLHPFVSNYTYTNLLLNTVLSDSRIYTPQLTNLMLNAYGVIGKNGNLLLVQSIQAKSHTALEYCLAHCTNTLINPNDYFGCRTALEYMHRSNLAGMFPKYMVQSLESLHERDLIISEHCGHQNKHMPTNAL